MPQAFGSLFSISKANLQILYTLLRSIALNEGGIKVGPGFLIRLLQRIHLIHNLLSLFKILFLIIKLGIELNDLGLIIRDLLLQTAHLLDQGNKALLKLGSAIDDGGHGDGGLRTHLNMSEKYKKYQIEIHSYSGQPPTSIQNS